MVYVCVCVLVKIAKSTTTELEKGVRSKNCLRLTKLAVRNGVLYGEEMYLTLHKHLHQSKGPSSAVDSSDGDIVLPR